MKKASELVQKIDNNVKAIKDTKEYKYAITKLEKYLEEAARNCERRIHYQMCALYDKDYPYNFKAILAALKEECQENGYYFAEDRVLSRLGGYNWCFEVTW